MPFSGIQSTYRSEIRGMWCLPGISVMEEQPFCQSQRSLLHSRFMKDGSQRKHVCSQICVLFSCGCTGKHHAVLPCCRLASFPKTATIIAHSGDNTDSACRDWSRQVSCGAQRLQSQGSLLCLCPCPAQDIWLCTPSQLSCPFPVLTTLSESLTLLRQCFGP